MNVTRNLMGVIAASTKFIIFHLILNVLENYFDLLSQYSTVLFVDFFQSQSGFFPKSKRLPCDSVLSVRTVRV